MCDLTIGVLPIALPLEQEGRASEVIRVTLVAAAARSPVASAPILRLSFE